MSICPKSHLRHPSSRFSRLTPPARVSCDARLPLHLNTQNYTQVVQSTNQLQVPIDNSREEALIEGHRTWACQQSMAMAFFKLLLSLVLPFLLPLSLLGAWSCLLLSSRLTALMMAFFPLLMFLSSHSSLVHPSPFSFFTQAHGLFPQGLGSASEGFFGARGNGVLWRTATERFSSQLPCAHWI